MTKRALLAAGIILLFCIMIVSGCKGSSGDTGAQGATGPTGPAGPTLPSVTSTDPSDLSASAPLDAVIRIVFSKSMNAATITPGTLTVTAGATAIAGLISYNSGSKTAYFDPNAALPAFTYITVTLSTGIQDTGGNALSQNYVWSFTTGGSFSASRLYVVSSANQIGVFNRPRVGDMTSLPDRLISGASTSFALPYAMWLDSASDRLFVSNFGSSQILIFNNAGTANGNIAPSRVISGATTSLDGPVGLWLDSAKDQLYVVNWGGSSVVVFSSASTTSGNIAPSRIISGPTASLFTPYSLWLDTTKDELYVSNAYGNKISVFSSASTTSGDIAPSRVISGPTATLNNPYGIWLDSASDSLYVANQLSRNVLVFNNASTATGDVAPARMISSADTGLVDPLAIWLDNATDRLYVGNYNGNKISIVKNASSANGDIAPATAFPFSFPGGLWLDTSE